MMHDKTLYLPAFLGLRADKRPAEVIRERPAATAESLRKMTSPKAASSRTKIQARPSRVRANAIAGITISNPSKPLFPEAQLTKRDVALYYHEMAKWILPHLHNTR
ncbi:MAG: hypothetical protein WKH97_10115 [Casimicrobiaceae bacterium]